VATIVLWPALAAVPQDTLDSAALEGVGRWGQFWRIALPQCWPAVVAAWIVALAIAAGEVAATILVIPPGVTTLSVQVFTLLHYGVEDRLASISLVMMLGSAGLTLAALACLRRFRLGSRNSTI
jgi:ABC-type spermidine/putrescine transport system permease subunit II